MSPLKEITGAELIVGIVAERIVNGSDGRPSP